MAVMAESFTYLRLPEILTRYKKAGINMNKIRPIDLFAALLVFILAFGLRISLVDRLYQYTFEPDSESCVEETRSFYFFFKNPAKENLPHTLTFYPNYSDGDFIVSSVAANFIRPLCKAGIIKAPIGDGDNSLIIFSTRWTNLFLDALAASLAFIILILLSGNTLLSIGIILLYYLLNPQTLFIDLMRIDHYILFAANLVVLSTILLLRQPGKKRYYLLCGIAAGLVSATKINFPFYLVIMAIAVGALIFQRKITVARFFILCMAFLLTSAFMYQRWLMYPENIIRVVRTTLNIGHDWFLFWGNGHPFYYLWNSFYLHGYSSGILLLLVLGCMAFALATRKSWVKRDTLMMVVCITFIIQSVVLIFSPKVARYGIIVPLNLSIFLIYGVVNLTSNFEKQWNKMIAQSLFLLLLLPSFLYAMKDYSLLKEKMAHGKESIIKTRIEPAEWIKTNAIPGSVIAIQHPHASNPPIFELPISFEENLLNFPFLDREKFLNFYPPDTIALKKQVNYIIISDHEKERHYYSLREYHADTTLIKAWDNFYLSLNRLYPNHQFWSVYDNYGIKGTIIYEVNATPLEKPHLIINCATIINSGVAFKWEVNNIKPNEQYSFQVQIGEDSTMCWLISGSRDGYPSRYTADHDPVDLYYRHTTFIPASVYKAFADGRFNRLVGGNWKDKLPDIENFFFRVTFQMAANDMTFSEAEMTAREKSDHTEFLRLLDSIYAGQNILQSKAEQYAKITGVVINEADLKKLNSNFVYKPTLNFAKGKKYYWRVRLRLKENVMSSWSNINSFSL